MSRPDEHTESAERGATAVEYALMVGLVALVIIIGVTAFGTSVLGLFEKLCTAPGTPFPC